MVMTDQLASEVLNMSYGLGWLCLALGILIPARGLWEFRKSPGDRIFDPWIALCLAPACLPYSWFILDPELGVELYRNGFRRSLVFPVAAVLCTTIVVRAFQTGTIHLGEMGDNLPAHRNGSAVSRERFYCGVIACTVFAAVGWYVTWRIAAYFA